jgi:C1A family cysteine protease
MDLVQGRKLTWKKSPKDKRDLLFKAHPKATGPILEQSDFKYLDSPIEDQGQTGSCVGNSTVSCLEYLQNKHGRTFTDMSRMMLYYQARAEQGWQNTDDGCYIRDAIKVANRDGVCHESLWPFDPKLLYTKPTPECFANAQEHQLVEYYKVTTLDEVLIAISAGLPIVFGIQLYPQFMEVGKDGMVKKPGCFDRSIGGHAMKISGHSMKHELLTVKNSWSRGWGDNGYCYIPFKYFKSKADDMTVLISGEEM